MRKGSLELSINAIVILIMAIAMVGVGIFFIKSVLQGQLEGAITIGDDIKAQIADEMTRTNNELFVSGLSQNKLVIQSGKSNHVIIAIKNKKESVLEYYVLLEFVKSQDSNGNTETPDEGIGVSNFGDVYTTAPTSGFLEIPIAGFAFEPVNFKSANTRGQELYRVTVMTRPKGASTAFETYATQSFFVEVQ